MFCPQCGTHNDDNAWRCISCGTELHAPIAPPPFEAQPVTSSKAIWSFVLAVLGPCCCTAIMGAVAIVLGIQARKEIKESGGGLKGDGLALAGIIIGVIDVIIGILFPILFFVLGGLEQGFFQ